MRHRTSLQAPCRRAVVQPGSGWRGMAVRTRVDGDAWAATCVCLLGESSTSALSWPTQNRCRGLWTISNCVCLSPPSWQSITAPQLGSSTPGSCRRHQLHLPYSWPQLGGQLWRGWCAFLVYVQAQKLCLCHTATVCQNPAGSLQVSSPLPGMRAPHVCVHTSLVGAHTSLNWCAWIESPVRTR